MLVGGLKPLRLEPWQALSEPGAWRRVMQAALERIWYGVRHPGLGLALVMIGIGVLGLWDKAMQTLALMLVAKAIFATVIYAVVPVTRLTDLGIRLVDREVVEASEAFGAMSRQQLFGVYLPLALPNIMAGINPRQTLM